MKLLLLKHYKMLFKNLNAKQYYFSPGTKIGDKKYIDLVNEVIPEL